MRAMAVFVLLAALLWPAAAVEPVCCDGDGEVSAAACHVYCEWNGVNFSHWLYVAYLEVGD